MQGNELVPILRGVSHQWAFWVALVAVAPLVLVAPTGTARLAALVYGAGLCLMLAASAAFHRLRCGESLRSWLCRIDHSAIYFFIAASYTPVALIILDGWQRWALLGSVWGGCIGGVALSIVWITAPRVLFAISYVAIGWVVIIAVPQLLERLEAMPLILLAAGGLLYSAGAVVYSLKRPDPWPTTFGFHELFHALVIGAAIAHFVAMAGWIIPAG
jgi:hemolysin III